MVETVDSTKLADKLNKAVEAAKRPGPLPVMVQVCASTGSTSWCFWSAGVRAEAHAATSLKRHAAWAAGVLA